MWSFQGSTSHYFGLMTLLKIKKLASIDNRSLYQYIWQIKCKYTLIHSTVHMMLTALCRNYNDANAVVCLAPCLTAWNPCESRQGGGPRIFVDHMVRLTIWDHLFLEFSLVSNWFFAHRRHQRALTRLENVRQINIRRGRELGFPGLEAYIYTNFSQPFF